MNSLNSTAAATNEKSSSFRAGGDFNLSAIIITKNEEDNIKDCLEALAGWVDEIIIIDSYSVDRTLVKAKKFKVKIYQTKTGSFAERRKIGMAKAGGEWLLFVDADERVTDKLKNEILTKVKHPSKDSAFMIPRLNIFFGRPMRYGGWFPDYQTRLFKKANLKGFFGKIHESASVEGKVGKLKNYFIHLSHLSIAKGFEKSSKWTQMEADLLFQANHPKIKIYHLLKAPLVEFLNRVISKKGLTDGTVGWLEGLIQALNKFLVYTQLWEKQQKSYR